jgi:hypothetical protein
MRRAINRLLKPVGIEIRRVRLDDYNATLDFLGTKYREAVHELERCYNQLVFPTLTAAAGRSQLLARLVGTPVSEAMYIIAFLAACVTLEGDVCEFGIAQGATSALLANEIAAFGRKRLWLFDSFKGLPKPTEKDVLINDIFNLGSMERYTGTMASPVEMVKERLAAINFPEERTRIVPGFIEESIKTAQSLPEKVCFAYVDFDFYEPIRTTLEFLRDRIPVGGVVIVDDYGFFSSGAKTAVDEFMNNVGKQFSMILPLECAAVSTPFCILRKEACA